MEIVDENSEPLLQNKRGRKPLYPWDEWLRHNKPVRIVEGVDFQCKLSTMRQQAFTQAANRHGTLKTSTGEDLAGRHVLELTFSFTEAYLRKMERTAREGDKAMGIDNSIPTHVREEPRGQQVHFDIDDDETTLMDNPVARNGKKWGPPSE